MNKLSLTEFVCFFFIKFQHCYLCQIIRVVFEIFVLLNRKKNLDMRIIANSDKHFISIG